MTSLKPKSFIDGNGQHLYTKRFFDLPKKQIQVATNTTPKKAEKVVQEKKIA